MELVVKNAITLAKPCSGFKRSSSAKANPVYSRNG